jgi:uncharacterized protein (DUF433 family)
MPDTIIDHRIGNTRITVWDVLHYLEHGWSHREIAEVLRLSEDQVQAAVDYIADHRDEVMAVHKEIEARNARGNPPEIRQKLAASRARRERKGSPRTSTSSTSR